MFQKLPLGENSVLGFLLKHAINDSHVILLGLIGITELMNLTSWKIFIGFVIALVVS